MKKIILSVVAIISAITFTSCENSIPSANLNNDIDTLSYSYGLMQSDGFKSYLTERLGIDSTYMDEVIKGINEGVNAGDDKKQQAYLYGLQLGQMISQQWVPGLNNQVFGADTTQTVSMKNLLAGFIAGATGKKQIMTVDDARQAFEAKSQDIMRTAMEKTYGEWKAENAKWLADNAKKEGVQTLPSGVQYKVITEGTGEIPTAESTVVVNYEGSFIDGTVFDSSYKRGEAITFNAGQVIKGWTDALCHMPVGSTWEVYIPENLAYGAESRQGMKPFSTLIFKIELVEIKK